MTIDRLRVALSDRYTIERELGAGGMATVYLAHDLKHDRQVAIKVLKPELAAVLGAERFVQEIKTTAALSHPHILPLFDSGSADGQLYYVMPYIEGETVREKLNRETQFGIDEAVRITTEVADALDYAHRHGVIHRDIKPENILLHDGRPMVMDFGIALAVSAAAGGRMTETGLCLGTPHYMSPEQATADKEITGRSDIYSLAQRALRNARRRAATHRRLGAAGHHEDRGRGRSNRSRSSGRACRRMSRRRWPRRWRSCRRIGLPPRRNLPRRWAIRRSTPRLPRWPRARRDAGASWRRPVSSSPPQGWPVAGCLAEPAAHQAMPKRP